MRCLQVNLQHLLNCKYACYTARMIAQNSPLLEALKLAINGSGVSRYHLAKQVGISESVLSRFINGQQGITLSTADKLATLLGMELVQTISGVKRKLRGAEYMETTQQTKKPMKERYQVPASEVVEMTAKQAHEEWFGNHRGLVNGLGDVPIILFDNHPYSKLFPCAKRAQQHQELIDWCAERGIAVVAKGSYPKSSRERPEEVGYTVTIGFGPGPGGVQKSSQAIMKRWDEIVLQHYARPSSLHTVVTEHRPQSD